MMEVFVLLDTHNQNFTVITQVRYIIIPPSSTGEGTENKTINRLHKR